MWMNALEFITAVAKGNVVTRLVPFIVNVELASFLVWTEKDVKVRKLANSSSACGGILTPKEKQTL